MKQSTTCDLPSNGQLCSGSNPEYSYSASIDNGVVTINMKFNGKTHTFTTTDKYRVASDVHDYYHNNK
jgi:hypothetical protein